MRKGIDPKLVILQSICKQKHSNGIIGTMCHVTVAHAMGILQDCAGVVMMGTPQIETIVQSDKCQSQTFTDERFARNKGQEVASYNMPLKSVLFRT